MRINKEVNWTITYVRSDEVHTILPGTPVSLKSNMYEYEHFISVTIYYLVLRQTAAKAGSYAIYLSLVLRSSSNNNVIASLVPGTCSGYSYSVYTYICICGFPLIS